MYIIVFFMMISVVTPSIDVGRANQRGANSPHIQTDRSGQLYAKSFPFDRYGSRGATKIYQLGRKDRATGLIKSDTLLHTYHCHWYAQKLYLAGNAGYKEIYVIQMGPPIKRYRASSDHLAIAFHMNGELLKRYTTVDIVGHSKNAADPSFDYRVFTEPGVVRRSYGNTVFFDITTPDRQEWTFDLRTGNRLVFYGPKTREETATTN